MHKVPVKLPVAAGELRELPIACCDVCGISHKSMVTGQLARRWQTRPWFAWKSMSKALTKWIDCCWRQLLTSSAAGRSVLTRLLLQLAKKKTLSRTSSNRSCCNRGSSIELRAGDSLHTWHTLILAARPDQKPIRDHFFHETDPGGAILPVPRRNLVII